MKVAALYDVHGNLPALEAVLREVDADHHILYSSNCQDGLWRVVLP